MLKACVGVSSPKGRVVLRCIGVEWRRRRGTFACRAVVLAVAACEAVRLVGA